MATGVPRPPWPRDSVTPMLARMERILGSPITLLTGEEEARLCFLGQRAGVWVGDAPVLGLDLGGGSLEAGIGTVDSVVSVASVALGTARIRGELDTGDRLTACLLYTSPSPRDR